jgi:hypothetical protein
VTGQHLADHRVERGTLCTLHHHRSSVGAQHAGQHLQHLSSNAVLHESVKDAVPPHTVVCSPSVQEGEVRLLAVLEARGDHFMQREDLVHRRAPSAESSLLLRKDAQTIRPGCEAAKQE